MGAVFRQLSFIWGITTPTAIFGGLRTLPVSEDELCESVCEFRFVDALKLQLLAPRRSDYRSRQILVGARQQAILALYHLAQPLFLILWKVGIIGDPYCPMFQSMHGFLVGHRLLVEALVLPDNVVISADRRGLLVGNRIV